MEYGVFCRLCVFLNGISKEVWAYDEETQAQIADDREVLVIVEVLRLKVEKKQVLTQAWKVLTIQVLMTVEVSNCVVEVTPF